MTREGSGIGLQNLQDHQLRHVIYANLYVDSWARGCRTRSRVLLRRIKIIEMGSIYWYKSDILRVGGA
jgi:hypothetical protein